MAEQVSWSWDISDKHFGPRYSATISTTWTFLPLRPKKEEREFPSRRHGSRARLWRCSRPPPARSSIWVPRVVSSATTPTLFKCDAMQLFRRPSPPSRPSPRRTRTCPPTFGFTHYQQPHTVSKHATLWIQDLLLALQRITREIDDPPIRGVKGTTGTQASLLELRDGDHDNVKVGDRRVCQLIGRFLITSCACTQPTPQLVATHSSAACANSWVDSL
jgi:hypothetical protein